MRTLILSFLLIASCFSLTQSQCESISRPPQFVLLSFDNCQELQTWSQISSFFEELNGHSTQPIHFTFFLSAVGLLTEQNGNHYQNPAHLANENRNTARDVNRSKFPERARRLAYGGEFSDSGESNIGFGEDETTLLKRIAFLNQLHRQGNEIASHAVGHYDGSKWTEAMWRHEFEQYNYIIDHVAEVNELTGPAAAQAKLNFSSRDLQSFRAPYLGKNEALLRVLRDFGYQADSSDINMGYEDEVWPHKYSVDGDSDGAWNFGLSWVNAPSNSSIGRLHLPSMDYNWCYVQTNGCESDNQERTDAAVRDARDMFIAYTNHFLKNYNSNRAPVVIGHHFFPYRGGVYNEALLHFARIVCSQPETQCVTFQDFAKYMNKLDPAVRELFQSAEFSASKYHPTLHDLTGINNPDE